MEWSEKIEFFFNYANNFPFQNDFLIFFSILFSIYSFFQIFFSLRICVNNDTKGYATFKTM